MAFEKYSETTNPAIDVNDLIAKLRTRQINEKNILALAKSGQLSSTDYARILIEECDVLGQCDCCLQTEIRNDN